ncbi:MAG: host attachment protein [Brevundimonas sp.]
MQFYGKSLVVVADGENARLFEERRRGGPLSEQPSWIEGLEPAGAEAPPKGRVFERFGKGSHTVEATPPKERSEARFLQDLAARLDRLIADEPFDEVILIAPPRALGVLRSSLSAASLKRLGPGEAAERCDETPAALRSVIRRLRNQA